MNPPRTQRLVECSTCGRTDVPLVDDHPFMKSHTTALDSTWRCSAGGTGRWSDGSLRRIPDPDHDGQCEAEFIHGPMLWTACCCAERTAGAGAQ